MGRPKSVDSLWTDSHKLWERLAVRPDISTDLRRNEAFSQPELARHFHPELILVHRLCANDVIQAVQVFLEHGDERLRKVVDPHRAEDDIRKAVDVLAFAQVVDKELAETSLCA